MAPDNPNIAAKGISYFTPAQAPPAGTALDPQPCDKQIPKLFQPIKIRGVEFQNRIFLSPMCQYSAEDGRLTQWHQGHLDAIIMRGPGLSMVESTAVLPEGRITPEDSGLWSDKHLEPLCKIVEFAHSQGQKVGIQLGHAGRKASTVAPWIGGDATASEAVNGWPDNVWGPSAIAYEETYPKPKELSKEGIKAVVAAFVDATKRAIKAGFDVIELHAAHGYLLHSFLSPASNKRTDEYGGSFDNRIRLILEVVDAVRAVMPNDMPLFVRISATDWLEESLPHEPSWRSDDTVKIAPILCNHGVDFLDVSTGGNHHAQKIKGAHIYQVPFAHAVKKSLDSATNLMVGAVGLIRDGETAQGVLHKGQADAVFVGRQFLKNPSTVWAFAEALGIEVHLAHQIGWGFKGRHKRCSDGKEDHSGRVGHKCEV